MSFKENFFQHNGVSIKYYEKGSGETILFLQGGGVRALTYKKILTGLSNKYHVIAPDIPCFGSGTVPKEIWGLEDYGNFFAEFVKFLNIQDFILVGHSLGGGIALDLSTKSIGLKKLVIVDSAGKNNRYSQTKFLYKFYIEKTLYDLLLYGNLSTFFLMLKDFLLNRARKSFKWSAIVIIVRKCLFNNFTYFNKINTPTLILWGNQDEIFPPNLAKNINEEISNSTLIFTNGNHDWLLFKPNEFLKFLTDWLENKEFSKKF